MPDMDGDGIEDALEGVVRVAITAAGRAGEMLAREREQQMRQAQARSQQEAAELASRLAAERDAARASLAPVYRPEWWDSAQPEDIARAYQTARAWSDVDPEAVRAEQRITDELRNRYGIDLPASSASDPAAVREAMDRAEEARSAAAGERSTAQNEVIEGASVIAEADAIDGVVDELDQRRHDAGRDDVQGVTDALSGAEPQPTVHDAQESTVGVPGASADADQFSAGAAELDDRGAVLYDSADRRQAMASQLDGKADAATIDARVRADVAQGAPATDATKSASSRTPKARPNRNQSTRQAQKGQLSR